MSAGYYPKKKKNKRKTSKKETKRKRQYAREQYSNFLKKRKKRVNMVANDIKIFLMIKSKS